MPQGHPEKKTFRAIMKIREFFGLKQPTDTRKYGKAKNFLGMKNSQNRMTAHTRHDILKQNMFSRKT